MARKSDIPEIYQDANSRTDFLNYVRDLPIDGQTAAEMLSIFAKEYDVKFTADEFHSVGSVDKSA